MYHQQQHEHQQCQHHPPPQQPLQHQGNGIAAATADNNHVVVQESTSASNLDHALLESLFYNEMVMLEPSAVSGHSTVLSPPNEHDTPITIVEKEILRDFGVDGGTALFPAAAAAAPPAPIPETTVAVNDVRYGNGHAGLPQNNNSSNNTASAGATGYTNAVISPGVPLLQQQQQQQQQKQRQPQPIYQQHQLPSNPLHHQTQSSPTMQQYTNTMRPTYSVPPTATTSARTAAAAATATGAAPPGGMLAGPHPQQQQRQSPSQGGGQADNMVYMDPQATATAAAAAAAMLSPGNGNGGSIKIRSTASIPTAMAASTTATAAPKTAPLVHSSPTTVAEASVTYSHPFPATRMEGAPQHAPVPNGIYMQQQQQQPQRQPLAPPSSGSRNRHTNGHHAPVPAGGGASVPEDARARQLVDQFATLASRLGIELPDSVLRSLTSAATQNDPNLLLKQPRRSTKRAAATSGPPDAPASAGPTPTAPGTATALETARNTGKAKATPLSGTTTKNTTAPPTGSDGSGSTAENSTMAPTVMELRNMAEEAIAAVTQSNMNQTASKENLSGAASTTTSANNNNNSSAGEINNKPTYSKRRKKPRLSDCEAKLAKLKAENDQLKRHLQNVSNKAHKFDKEKEEAGKYIARLMDDPNSSPKEMEFSVRKFSDMYSDYGVNRQQELSFHLEQLQRLVNPTNFTKMGLWTLGQSPQGWKKNPIAGILVKELDITPQQGRKILDQSEKIRKLCDNLKEAHALLVKLKLLCEKKTRCFQDRMNKCTEILTSKQVVKLIIWINANTHLLEDICPGWGTEHIQSKK